MGHRKWVKLYCDNWLRGSLTDDPLEVRAVWAALLALAGDGGYNSDGYIQVAPGIGYTDEQISIIISTSMKVWLSAKKRLSDTERIKINDNNVITINKWKQYQSEYDRQKKYRQDKQD